ncbi:MAG: EamA family transporter [Rhodospirillaceae bacterium]|nr:EamA family transporter [Rhodospirillaceae bacterium]
MNIGSPEAIVADDTALSRRGSSVRIQGFACAALAVMIFAGWFVVTRFSMTHTMGVWDIMALRFAIGTVLLLPVLVLGKRLSRKHWLEGLLLAALWGAPFVLAVSIGVGLTSAAEAASLTPPLMPIFAGFLGWALLKDRPSRTRLLGYATIIVGLLGVVGGGMLASGLPDPVGISALVLAAALWAVYTLRFRRSGLTPIQAAALTCFWSAVVVLPLYLLLGVPKLAETPMSEVLIQAGYQGALMSVVAPSMFNRAVGLLGPAAAAAVIALLPTVATLLAFLFLGEVPGPIDGAAAAVIAAGVFLAARPGTPERA